MSSFFLFCGTTIIYSKLLCVSVAYNLAIILYLCYMHNDFGIMCASWFLFYLGVDVVRIRVRCLNLIITLAFVNEVALVVRVVETTVFGNAAGPRHLDYGVSRKEIV